MHIPGAAKDTIAAERASQLAFDQLELVMRSMKARWWVRPVIGIALALAFSGGAVLSTKPAIWFALLIAGSIPSNLIAQRFLTRSASATRSAACWQWLSCVAYAPFAMAWTSQVYFLWKPGNVVNHCMIMLALGCSVSVVMPLLGACLPLATTALVIVGSGFVGAALFGGTANPQIAALVVMVYLVLLYFILRQIHDASTNSLLLRYQNSDLLAQQSGLIEAKNKLISDLAVARQVAEQKRDEAESANRSKSQFLANMSHELRTPLNAIIGFSEIIKARILGDDINRNIEYAGLIHGSGMHLLTLINDILDLAKIESGTLKLAESDLTLGAVVAEAVALLQHRAREGGCTLVCVAEPGLPSVRADERAIKQILLNLLSNALKFTLPGGTVTAFVRRAPDECVAFGVLDTGVGIKAADQAKVFEKFGQGDHAHAPKERGTGLGLSIVRGLVHAHGGEIALESVEHKGTTITVTMPASRSVAKRQKAAQLAPA
jgi:two-component system, cell cycle sensor histidine kinase PleC